MTNIEQTPSVLLIDQDRSARLSARSALERSGFRVFEAEDADAGLAMSLEHRPELILLDVEIPGNEGFSVCSAIRNLPGFVDIPIVVLTRVEDEPSVEQAYDSGATDFIAKPINWTLLGHRARYILRSSRISRGLRDSEAENLAFVEAIPDSFFVVSDKGEVHSHHRGTEGNRLMDDQIGESKIIFDSLPEPLADLWRRQIALVLRTGLRQQCEHQYIVGERKYFFETRMVRFTNKRILIIVRDVSDQKLANQKVRRLAYYDTLTGLPNRQSFLIELSGAIRKAEQDGSEFAVLYIDLDNFKRINDSLGHSIGDALLTEIAARLGGCVRRDDVVARSRDNDTHEMHVARLGGDEFTVLLQNMHYVEEADAVAERIISSFREPLTYNGQQFVITPSIGIATYPRDGDDIDTLLKNADMAMYSAKNQGRNRVSQFSGTMSVRSLERLDLEDSLRRAISNGDLELHYQPRLSLETQAVTGVEALVRWTHPDRGPVSPAKFIPIAEEAGLIMDLSDWVLHAACDQLKAWTSGPLDKVNVAINLSAKQFYDEKVDQTIIAALSSRSLESHRLELELTEGTLMRDVDDTIRTMSRLREAGFKIAVDDFGTGYSSLSYLKKFPLDALKIDRSFVSEISSFGGYGSICSAIIALAHSLKLNVIAEGVETLGQLQNLKFLECDEIQGFYFARPMPADELFEFLSNYDAAEIHSGLFVGKTRS